MCFIEGGIIDEFTFFILIGYLSGSVMYGYVLPKVCKHIDIRELSDDGNPGTANAFKYAGVPIGIMVLLCELGKGIVPVFLAAKFLDITEISFAFVMIAPVLGHAFPIFLLGHQGGKSIAVSFGVLMGLWPDLKAALILAAFYILFSTVIVIRPHFHRSVVTFLCFDAACIFFVHNVAVLAACVMISILVIGKHLARYQGEKIEVETAHIKIMR